MALAGDLDETVSPELLLIIEAEMTWDEKLVAVVELVYNDESRPHNKTFKSGTGDNDTYLI